MRVNTTRQCSSPTNLPELDKSGIRWNSGDPSLFRHQYSSKQVRPVPDEGHPGLLQRGLVPGRKRPVAGFQENRFRFRLSTTSQNPVPVAVRLFCRLKTSVRVQSSFGLEGRVAAVKTYLQAESLGKAPAQTKNLWFLPIKSADPNQTETFFRFVPITTELNWGSFPGGSSAQIFESGYFIKNVK